MKPSRSALPLPRYVIRKFLKASGQWAYFFQPPAWARRQGCPVAAKPLGTDYRVAVTEAETIHLPQFDSWRSKGASDAVPDATRPGTLDWLTDTYGKSLKFRELDPKMQKLHRAGFRLVTDYRLKDGRRLGEIRLAAITPGVVDKVFEALLFVRETKTRADGTTEMVERQRRTTVNHAMKSCRRAWNVVGRADPKLVPAENPFARMGLKDTSKETPTATHDELLAFVAACDAAGRASIGTGALIAFEWLQRISHVFTAFEVGHYRPKDRPDMVRVVHPKTHEEAWIPLFAGDGAPLYPELVARLDAIRAARISGPMLVRDWVDEKAGVPLPWATKRGGLDHLNHEAKRLFEAAGLRPGLTLTSFRHGGFTEGADSDLTDAELRAIGRHKNAKTLPRYAKRTVRQIEQAQRKRLAARTDRGGLSE